MSKQGRTKLAPPDTRPENQALETVEKSSLPEQKDEPVLTELDIEIDCPRCKDIMESSQNSITSHTTVIAAD